MSFFLPLLLAGALAAPAATSNTAVDDTYPRTRPVVIDTAAHLLIATDLVRRATTAAEAGSLQEARAQLLTANTMFREAGGLSEAAVYKLVYVDYALERYVEAADILTELSDNCVKRNEVGVAARATADAALLYNLAGLHAQAGGAVKRVRELVRDPRISDADRAAIIYRLR